jgi:sigma-B regulation protein RsbU (phosphoserine phosphatase)
VNIAVGLVFGVAVVAVWALFMAFRRRGAQMTSAAKDMLVEFADRSLELGTVREILDFAGDAARVVFGSERAVVIEPGAREGSWEIAVAGGDSIGEVPPAMRGVLAWLRYNPDPINSAELAQARFGAMRGPLRQLLDLGGVDTLVPLLDGDKVLGGLGLRLGGRAVDQALLRLFQVQAATACANVRLHGEAAHSFSLAREVGTASAFHDALVASARNGVAGALRWAGDVETAGEVASDFWAVYPLKDGRVMMVVGDAVGAGLAASMASAVVKGCCDALIAGARPLPGPAALLSGLGRALYRPAAPIQSRCFAVLIDPARGVVEWANAGHPVPYHLRTAAAGGLGVLAGAGPMLGDGDRVEYRAHEAPFGAGDALVLFTDGLVKAEDRARKAFGERRLQKVIADLRGQPVTAIRRTILAAVREFRGDTPAVDDTALVVVDRDPAVDVAAPTPGRARSASRPMPPRPPVTPPPKPKP